MSELKGTRAPTLNSLTYQLGLNRGRFSNKQDYLSLEAELANISFVWSKGGKS